MMTPNVKRWDMVVRISVLLAIGCMVAGGGCSKPTGGLLTVEIAEQFLADTSSAILQYLTVILILCQTRGLPHILIMAKVS